MSPKLFCKKIPSCRGQKGLLPYLEPLIFYLYSNIPRNIRMVLKSGHSPSHHNTTAVGLSYQTKLSCSDANSLALGSRLEPNFLNAKRCDFVQQLYSDLRRHHKNNHILFLWYIF